MKKTALVWIFVLALLAAVYVGGRHQDATDSSAATTHSSGQQNSFNKHLYSTDDPASIWVVVNKLRPLDPKNYVPSDLMFPSVPLRVPGNESMQVRKLTADALQTMFAAAKSQGISLMLSSGYRSYTYQVNLYNGYVKDEGQATADSQSARPGYSEHQTGLAVDVESTSRNCEVEQCFANTAEGQWLAANAYRYGFIMRYPKDKVPVTGYEYEPWHFRYVGVSLATELHNQHVETLEEFFGLPAAPDYSSR